MNTYSETITKRHKIFVKEDIRINNISVLLAGLEYNVNEIINNSNVSGFVFNNGTQIIGRCNKERFLQENKNKYEFI